MSITSADKRKWLCLEGTSCSFLLADFDVPLALMAFLAKEQDGASVETGLVWAGGEDDFLRAL